ncbi:intermembrane phospholipid transport protein YdbH family protein [Zavarzinia compransoris]|uniref:Uncharacterized protein n=1 Tax=Zavarzinia compransoris TaxID=1264899 RepID=A0A317EF80_9PROT|nr:YdbH domain-containing protein [Zavarzinia compransoris]PWR24043.1 hypothetical protein DKG75_05745 [Zavarzinia compransoris]TDP48306.1 dicarboxylate transport [Zavarzinia compransoris]
MSDRAQSRRRIRPWLRAGLGLVLLLAGTALGAWIWRVELAGYVLVRVIEGQGLGPVAVRLEAVEGDRFIARDLSLRGGALRLDRLEMGFTLADLFDRRIETLALQGLRLDLEQGEAGWLAGGKPLFEAPAGEGAGDPLGGLRIGAFIVADTAVTLRRPAGSLTATLDTTLALGGTGIEGAALTATLSGPLAGAPRAVVLTATGMTLALDAGGGIRLGLLGVAATEAGLPWALSGADLTLGLAGDAIDLAVRTAEVRNLQQPALLIPMSVSLNAGLKGSTLNVAAQARGRDLPALALDLGGDYDMAADRATVKLALAPLVFAPKGLQPQALSPAFGGGLSEVSGRLALTGTVTFDKGKLTSALDLALGDGGFVADVVTVSGVSGKIRITRPWPLATAARQRLSATVASGSEKAVLDVTGQVLSPTRLRIDRLAIGAAGGEMVAEGMEADLARSRLAGRFEVRRLDLAEVTRLIGIEGLAGTGSLDGVIPLEVDGGQFAIRSGRLSAAGPGTLYYRPGNLPPQIAGAGAEMDLTLRALSDFRYQSLELGLEKAPDGQGHVQLSMTGANPGVLDNQPFTFNIRIESNFARLADLVLLGLRSAQDLLGRAAGSVKP